MIDHLKYLNIPYWEKYSSFDGCDCIGLVRLLYLTEYGIELEEFTSYDSEWKLASPKEAATLPKKWGFKQVNTASVGDVVVIRDEEFYKHLGVVIRPGYYIHTDKSGTAVKPLQFGVAKKIYHRKKVSI